MLMMLMMLLLRHMAGVESKPGCACSCSCVNMCRCDSQCELTMAICTHDCGWVAPLIRFVHVLRTESLRPKPQAGPIAVLLRRFADYV